MEISAYFLCTTNVEELKLSYLVLARISGNDAWDLNDGLIENEIDDWLRT